MRDLDVWVNAIAANANLYSTKEVARFLTEDPHLNDYNLSGGDSVNVSTRTSFSVIIGI